MIKQRMIIVIGLVLFWQLLVTLFSLPHYILPSPWQVMLAFYHNASLLLFHSSITLLETLLGFVIGTIWAIFVALAIAYYPRLKTWLLPLIVISQSLPMFALAPLIVLWFGYGFISKIMVTIMMIFFPITSSMVDGLMRTPSEWLDLATVMGADPKQILWKIRVPGAAPALASGLKVASVYAPMGAIIGEWVGASHGLGYLLLIANAQLKIPLMFAGLLLLLIFSMGLYSLVNFGTRKWLSP